MLLSAAAIAAPPQTDGNRTARATKRALHHPRTKAGAKPAVVLSADFAQALNWSVRGGKHGLLASVFDNVRTDPSQRDAVLAHARSLAPGLARDLTTAADLGVLVAGQPLQLAPNAADVLSRPRATATQPAWMTAGAGPASQPAPQAFAPPTMPSQGSQTWHLDMIRADAAYARGFTGAGVTVAVGDTGFDISHPALAGKLDLARAYTNLVVQGQTYDPSNVDIQIPTDIHGSHVAGIIAGKKDDQLWDSHGVAYGASIVPIRMIFERGVQGEYVVPDAVADGINYFTSLSDVKVMNASFGPSVDPKAPPQTVWEVGPYTFFEAEAAYHALAADKIIVAANGNDRDRHSLAGRNPSGLALYPFIRPEHANTGVYDDFGANLNYSWLLHQPGLIIAVMSVGSTKAPAYYSNLCGVTASWCVAAPGGDQSGGAEGGVFSTVPRSQYEFEQGTSMAAPTVSGAIAVLISAYPDYSARDLANVLFSTTENIGDPGINAVYGHGLIRLDRATDGPTTLAPNHTETVATDTTIYWSRPLEAGAFAKDGDGILTISGRTNATGNVQVGAGTLAVDGTLSVVGNGNALTISQTGTLAGFGTVNGNTAIAGTLSPGKMANVEDLVANHVIAAGTTLVGNSAGMLTFNGNVTLTSTATTRIDIDGNLIVPGGPGTFDRIVVTGAGNTFTADGTLTPVLRDSVGTPSNYTPSVGTHFAFVQAIEGARTAGAFASLVQPTSGMPANGRFDLIYSPSAITLAVTPLTFAGLANEVPLTSVQRHIANMLDNNRPAAGAVPGMTTKALFDALYSLATPVAYATGLTQLSAPGQPAATSSPMTGVAGFLGSVSDRQSALVAGSADAQSGASQSIAFAYAGGAMSAEARRAEAAFASLMPAAASPDDWSVWGQAFGRWSSVGDADGLAGSKTQSGGFSIGADRLITPDMIGGIALGFARTTTDSAGSHATADSYAGAIYTSWTPGRAVIDARIAGGPSQIRTSRSTVLTPSAITGSTDGLGGSVAAEVGYLFALGQYVLKPYAGVTLQAFRRNGYSETQQPIGLIYPAQSFEKLATTLGVALSASHRSENGVTLMPELKLAWAHDLRDTTLVSQGALLDSDFTVTAANPGRDAALVGLKLSGWTSERLRLFTAYNGEFRSNAASHQLSGGLRYTW